MKTIVKVFNVEGSFLKNQCYLVYKNNVGILIDPAWNYTLINNFVIENNIVLKGILLTHSHTDHTNLANEFAVKNNIPVYMSEEEIDHYDFTCSNLEKVAHLTSISIDHFGIMPLVTPGHTVGSTCYLIDGNIFCGDTVFIEGVGICNRNDADMLYDSIQFLKSFLPEDTLFWPGHSFGELPGGNLKSLMRQNIYFQFENKSHFVDFRTRKNRPNPFAFK